MESLLTILQIFLIAADDIDPKELKFLFGSEEEKKEHKLDKDNRIALFPQYPKSHVYYFETIVVKYKKRIMVRFQFLVYISKNNNIIIDLNEQDKPSFELFFYSKNSIFSPTCLKYKNKEYRHFENYGNKYRTRTFFANVDPKKLQYINSETMNQYKFDFLDNNTYQVLFRIIDNSKFEVSMTNMDSYYENDLEFFIEKKILTKPEFEELENKLKDFYDKFDKYMSLDSALIDERRTAYSELKNSSKNIEENNVSNFLDNPDTYEIGEIIHEKLLNLFHYDFSLNQFLKLDEEAKYKFEVTRMKVLKLQNIEKQLYNKLGNDKNLNIEEKIKILKTITIFFSNSLLTDKKIFGVDYINNRVISNDSPYYKSNEMLKKIISELTEESRLFEAFMYFDSKVIENILNKNMQKDYEFKNIFGQKIEVKQPEYITEYGLSLMTVDEIKKHLLALLPTIIVKIDTTLNMRALYEDKTKIMIINELQMFGELFTENEKIFKIESNCYVVPISMEVLHEAMSHGKLRLNNKNDNSPLVIRDSKYDFKAQKLIKKIKLDFTNEIKVNKGETGRVLEHYISEDKSVIQILKERTKNTEIIDTKYWTGINFDALHKILNSDEQNGSFSKFQKEIILDDYDYDNEYNCECLLHK